MANAGRASACRAHLCLVGAGVVCWGLAIWVVYRALCGA